MGMLLHSTLIKIGEEGSIRRRFASGAFWSLAASVLSRSFLLAAAILCARFLGKGGFGKLSIVQSTANTLSVLAALGLSVTATRYVADLRTSDPERTGRIIGLSWVVAIISGIAMTTGSIAFAPWIARVLLHDSQLTTALRIASALILVNAMISFQNGALAGFEAFRRMTGNSLASGIVSLPMIVLGVWRWGIEGALAAIALSLAVQWALNEHVLRAICRDASIQMNISHCWRESSIFWNFSVPALLASLATAPVLWICNLMIVRSPQGFQQMALFAGADRWRVVILFIPTALFRSVLPMLSNLHRDNPTGYKRIAQANLWMSIALVAIPVCLVALFSKSIMAIYGSGFRVGWSTLIILCLAAIPEALNTILGYPLIVTGRMWSRFLFDLLLAFVMLAASFILIPRYGAFGFALAYAAAFTVTSLGLLIFTRDPIGGQFMYGEERSSC